MNIRYRIECPLDDPGRTLIHRKLLFSKRFLMNLYTDWYGEFKNNIRELPPGRLVELGSGGGFLKEVIPEVITSDILPGPYVDITFSALKIPFEDESVSGLFLLDTFHHIPDAGKFLSEANRVLKAGGTITMIEPANTFWGRWIYKNFHHEAFDEKGNWYFTGTGPLSASNIALPWIVFVRDREQFIKSYPYLEIRKIKYHSSFSYLLSGGFSFHQLVPDFSYRFFSGIDHFLTNILPGSSMFMTIVIAKRATQ